MSKKKRNGKADSTQSKLDLTASIINLVTALLLLIEKLNE